MKFYEIHRLIQIVVVAQFVCRYENDFKNRFSYSSIFTIIMIHLDAEKTVLLFNFNRSMNHIKNFETQLFLILSMEDICYRNY